MPLVKFKLSFIFFLLTFLPSLIFAQQTINDSILHGNIKRQYILYVPQNYTGNTAVPLVFNFHGLGSNAFEQMYYGNFRSIADTAGFIIAHPQGTVYQGNTHWNVSGLSASQVDDIGFTSTLIDTITSNYNIDTSRIYATGMSNGGYLSIYLACQLSDKIAAVASVTGSMTPQAKNNCNAQHATPVLQIHGTSDGTVPYNGTFWTENIIDLMEYWANFNNCSIIPTITPLPDLDTTDQCTVEHYVYSGGTNGSVCEHFKIINGEHTWPGSPFGSAVTNQDINASKEIWRFFSKYSLLNLTSTIGTNELEKNDLSLRISPNPSSSYLTIEGELNTTETFYVISIQGEVLISGEVSQTDRTIDIAKLSPNIYFVKVGDATFKVLKID